MWKNYFKIAWRNLLKDKIFSLINILGLAIGMAACLLILQYVNFEFSYDTFHEKADRIYRIAKENPGSYFLGNNQYAVSPGPLAKALMEEIPEVEHAAQIDHANSLLEYGDKRFYEDGIYATEHFFDLFTFVLLQGNPRTALVDPYSIILTESLAQKYFGDANPIGQTLTVTHSGEHYNGKNEMKVTGIVEDVPANSHFSFDYLVPVSSSLELLTYLDKWNSDSYLTYVSLRPDHSLPEFATKLRTLASKYLTEVAYYKDRPDDIPTYFPQALTDIHLRSHINFEFGVNGDIKYVYLFSAIALVILLIACINYINLATARSVTRATEVGVRKVMGAHRNQLIGQFMGEALMPSVGALLVALFLVPLLLPTLNTLTGRDMAVNLSQQGGLVAMLLFVGLGVGILAGSYPAFFMASFHPIGMMKGVVQQGAGKTTLRNVLVVVQFSITMVLIIGTFVIQRQLSYVQSAHTGIDRDQVISIEIKDRSLHERYAALKQTLLRHPNVLGVTAAQTDPTNIDASSYATEWEGGEEGRRIMVYRSAVHYDFVDLFGLELLEGRDFSEAIATDEREGMLINETLKRALGWDTAVGKWFNYHGRKARIIGVVKDFSFLSFHHEMAPLALFLQPGWFSFGRIFVKVRPNEMQKTLASLDETMAEFSPEYPFEYYFLDDAYNRMYQTEIRQGNLFSYFTGLALFIACLGLLGLASFTASQRTKEIGIRKVLGASVVGIMTLLSKDFLKLLLIAFVIAVPIASYVMHRWLEDFAYRIGISWWFFAGAGLMTMLIALATVSFQSIKTALMNPVDSLRSE